MKIDKWLKIRFIESQKEVIDEIISSDNLHQKNWELDRYH